MAGHGRSCWMLLVGLIAVTTADAARVLAQNDGLNDGQEEVPPGNPIAAVSRPDACLRDVTFVDPRNGWAVGDCGVIWHTADGGQRWEQQSSGVDCRLESVSFIDATNGWAAGGFTMPYTHLSTGVIVHTTDGGQHWAAMDKLLLPEIASIRFFDPTHGWIIGGYSTLYTSNVFHTDNGGRAWTPANEVSPNRLLFDPGFAGDFSSPGNGAMISWRGDVFQMRSGSIQRQQGLDDFQWNGSPWKPVRRLRFSGRDIAWSVGRMGLALRSNDGGASWKQVDTIPLIHEDRFGPHGREQIDFSGVAVRGSKVWIGGSSGSIIFHSDDEGKSWQIQTTPQASSIESLFFLDDRHGWAVGAMGTILVTADGGQTWRSQTAGGDHVALLGIFSDASEIPLELLAKASASDGHLSAVELLNRRDLDTPSRDEQMLSGRVAEALAMLGVQDVTTESQFPLRQRGLEMPVEKTMAVWDQLADGHALELLEAQIVQRIRTWRPEVVVVADVDDKSPAVNRLLQRVILQAIDRAAELSESAAIRPLTPALSRGGEREKSGRSNTVAQTSNGWRVKRVYAVAPAAQVGGLGLTLATNQLAPRLGRSLTEMTSQPRGVLFDEFKPAPDAFAFRLLKATDQQNGWSGDLFAGLDLRPGGGARRPVPAPNGQSLDGLRRNVAQRRNIEAILKRSSDSADRWLAQLGQLTAGLDEAAIAEILFQFGWQSYRGGHPEAAAGAFEQLIEQCPRSSLVSPARLWLLQYYASSIASRPARSAKGPNLSAVLPAAAALPLDQPTPGGVKLAAPANNGIEINPDAGKSPVRSATANSPASRAIQLGQQIERTDPSLYVEPRVRFPLAAAYRASGMPREAEHCLASIRRGAAADAWSACAESEARIAQGRGVPTRSVWHCARTGKRPRLDGALDDEIWSKAAAVELQSPIHDDADWPATAMLAYDEKFLYLAMRCRKAADAEYPAADGLRPRSADLSRNDRVDLLLSPDRDYATWYRISIDHRGWINTSCWGNDSWRPALFAAAATADDAWIIEAAIPWSELVDRPPTPGGQPWSANVQRIIPNVGFQSWSAPATIDVRPEGFGYLMFE